MSQIKLPEFYDNYVKSLLDGKAALFAGAGLSRDAGFVDWRGLLKEIADDLGLNVNEETDLIAVAQYHFNKRKTRSTINRKLIEEFTEDVTSTPNHKLLANLPIRTYWTTNYDTLIEQALTEAKKRYEVKHDTKNLAHSKRRIDATIYKMHGDISDPDNAVLTKDDYELYNRKRQAFTQILEGDLISQTFLFIGFSFTDPNIDHVLGRLRLLVDTGRDHYCIMRREPKTKGLQGKKLAAYEYAQLKQQLRIDDLGRYNIRTILVDEYRDITTILAELNRRVHLNDVFISGSAADYAPRGRDSIEQLSHNLGKVLIEHGCNLISGFGLGIGSHVIVGALEAAYANDRTNIDERLTLRPFPQSNPPSGLSIDEFRDKYRYSMLSKSGFAVFICGNKGASDKASLSKSGVMREFAISKELGIYPIPIGCTGHASQIIWREVNDNLSSFYPDIDVKQQFAVLGDADSTNTEIVKAIKSIITEARR